MDASDDPRAEDKPPETSSSETSELIKTFTESIKEITNLTKAQSVNSLITLQQQHHPQRQTCSTLTRHLWMSGNATMQKPEENYHAKTK